MNPPSLLISKGVPSYYFTFLDHTCGLSGMSPSPESSSSCPPSSSASPTLSFYTCLNVTLGYERISVVAADKLAPMVYDFIKFYRPGTNERTSIPGQNCSKPLNFLKQ